MNLPIPNISSSRIIQNMILYDWLHSLKVLRHVSIFSYYQTIPHCMYIPHFIYPFISRQTFGLFLLWAIINNTTVNILIQVLVCTYIFTSLVYIPRSGMLDHIVTLCLTFCGCARLFSKAAAAFTFSSAVVRVPSPPHPHQHILMSVFLIRAILVGMT